MKKTIIIVGMLIVLVSLAHVYAVHTAKDDQVYGGNGVESSIGKDPVLVDPGYIENNVDNTIKEKTKSIWATAAVLVQIASVACVVFAGLRYMFASADQKADIKTGLVYLSLGAILVFGAVSVIKLVAEAANTVLK